MIHSEDQRRYQNGASEGQLVMPCWYFEKEDLRNTPSIQDNIDYQTEMRYRHEGAKFIINCGTKLGLRYDTCATGVVFFHRFYMFHSFKSFPRYVTSACCLLLAGKIEETPKKCRDIVRAARSLLNDHQFSQFGQDPREEVMALERVLLKTIKFDLQADHPYRHLLQYGKKIRGDKDKVQQLIQMAWTFTNDSLCTTLCLQWEPEIVACALLYLATKLNKCEIEDWENKDRSASGAHKKWWEHFVPGMSLEVMEDICHQILDLYSKPSGGANPALGTSSSSASIPGSSTNTSTNTEMNTVVRRKRKADFIASTKTTTSNMSESIGIQAGGSRASRVQRTNNVSTVPASVSSTIAAVGGTFTSVPGIGAPMTNAGFSNAGHPMTAQQSASGVPYTGVPTATYPDPTSMASVTSADQYYDYSVLARQQQAAAAAAVAVYGGGPGGAGGYAPPGYVQPPPPPNHGYPGQPVPIPGSGMPIVSPNTPVRMSGGKIPNTSSNPSGIGGGSAGHSSGNFNPSVRITQRR